MFVFTAMTIIIPTTLSDLEKLTQKKAVSHMKWITERIRSYVNSLHMSNSMQAEWMNSFCTFIINIKLCLPDSQMFSSLSTEFNEYSRYPVFVPTIKELKIKQKYQVRSNSMYVQLTPLKLHTHTLSALLVLSVDNNAILKCLSLTIFIAIIFYMLQQ